MASDYITWFAGGKSVNRGVTAERRAASDTLWVFYCRGDGQKGLESPDPQILLKSGGILFRIIGSKEYRIDKQDGDGYKAPSKGYRLGLSSRPDQIGLAEETPVRLNAGDHLLVPVDRDSETELDQLVNSLNGLPGDQARSVLEALRRPSLELRVALLEELAQHGRSSKATERTLAHDESGSMRWLAWRKNRFVLPAACLIVGLLAGYFANKFEVPVHKLLTRSETDHSKSKEDAGTAEEKRTLSDNNRQIQHQQFLTDLLYAMLKSKNDIVAGLVIKYKLNEVKTPESDKNFADAILEWESALPSANLTLVQLLLCQAYDVAVPCEDLTEKRDPKIDARVKQLIGLAQKPSQGTTGGANPNKDKARNRTKDKDRQ